MTTSAAAREEIIARNLAAVDVHFHNENAEGIDLAVGVYTDDIVWKVLPGGWCTGTGRRSSRNLRIFGSMNVHKVTNLHRFATEEWVFDDSIFEFTIAGDGFRMPLPPGTRVSIRLVHAFQCRDGKICRENGYEIWRRADDPTTVRDDIPESATIVFAE